ncbi:hypothetical protein PGTUg99_027031 [Puccinia graminis f. sp. tritici]|uniref:Uncharacterized protein n=1 Tax=Puccinia graminis f. sp. tritici TaxID=56615 RepID=A0A5B0S1B4_PUCGR|nr:hypothetical protein PGTUg99_027031 [Puccinia graminis f. sp. tritici]
MQNSPSMSVPAEKSLIRRASGLLSNIASPFANHRASFLLDTSDPISNASEDSDSDEVMMGNGWSTRGKREKTTTANSQILVETFREVHTSPEQNSPRKDIRIMTNQSALMANTKSAATGQSLLKPHSYHYQKTSSSTNSSSQGYRVASQRLSYSSRSMEQLIMCEDIKSIVESSDFQAAFNGQLNLSPILDEPNSPESDATKVQVTAALRSFLEDGKRNRNNFFRQSPYWEAPENNRFSKEDYSSWIRFEKPIDLLSPTPSSEMASPSFLNTYNFGKQSEHPQGEIESCSMTREETQSYFGDSPIEAPFCMYTHSDLGNSSQNFGALSSAGLFIPPSNLNPLSPSLRVPKAEDHPRSGHQSLRKKISQSFKDTFGRPAQNRGATLKSKADQVSSLAYPLQIVWEM